MRALAILLVLLGCGDDQTQPPADASADAPGVDAPCFALDALEGDAGAVSFASDLAPIFRGRCALVECHASLAGGLDLTAGHAYANLVGVAARECASGRKYVEPGATERSYLVDKLRGSICDCMGERMPLGGPYLDDAEIARFIDWIRNGAPAN